MSQTMCEKLLSKKAHRRVQVGEYLELRPDVALANDVTAPPAIREFYKAGGVRVKDPQQLVLMPDHFTPNKDIASAGQVKMMREFAREQAIANYFEIGRMGIEHVVLPEEGLVGSGDLVVGADSHTCTYGGLGAFATGVGSTDVAGVYLAGLVWLKVPSSISVVIQGNGFKGHASAKDLMLTLIGKIGVDGANYRVLEFSGPGIKAISIEGRMTMANMAIEAGAKTALFPVDELTIAYEHERGLEVEALKADDDAFYESIIELDLDELEAVAAMPFLPSNICKIGDITPHQLPVDQVVIGSCTNGRIEDLRAAAAVMKGHQVDARVRCLIFPGSQRVYAQAMKEGLFDVFLKAQCAISTPTCGPCLGGHMGILAAGERAVATTNRNFVGRMGHPESEVILTSPATAAATAVKGYLCGPDELDSLN